ncbi:hypothetical protein [Streptomyces zaomyceticus]|uniref:Uncharacterized protein n=1 Tax=Streptomyces zaomyceticus TaxID=68286 RepID=A0ABZ1LRW7_9ACTN|nr:hypothetical protein OG237_42280 [Streptomyces zaomyceticus]
MHVIDERTIRPDLGQDGTTVRVQVLTIADTTSTVRIEDCGVIARQGQVHTVPADAVRTR